MTRGYETTGRRWVDLNSDGLPRQRRRGKVCADCRIPLVPGVGDWWTCPDCHCTPDETAPQYDTWDEVPSSATAEQAGQVAF